jgi:hypothetical protein
MLALLQMRTEAVICTSLGYQGSVQFRKQASAYLSLVESKRHRPEKQEKSNKMPRATERSTAKVRVANDTLVASM